MRPGGAGGRAGLPPASGRDLSGRVAGFEWGFGTDAALGVRFLSSREGRDRSPDFCQVGVAGAWSRNRTPGGASWRVSSGLVSPGVRLGLDSARRARELAAT